MKVHTIEPISIGGNRVEADSEADLEPAEYVRLARLGAVEAFEVYEARVSAKRVGDKARAEAEALAEKVESDARAKAARMADEAQAKAEGAAKNDARKRAENAKPVAS